MTKDLCFIEKHRLTDINTSMDPAIAINTVAYPRVRNLYYLIVLLLWILFMTLTEVGLKFLGKEN